MHSSDTLFAAHNKVRATGLLAAGISECAYWKVSTSQLSLLFSYLYIFDEYVFFTLHLSKWTLRLRWLVTGSTQTSESEMWRRFFAPAAVKFTTTNVNHERVQICRRYTHSRREDVRRHTRCSSNFRHVSACQPLHLSLDQSFIILTISSSLPAKLWSHWHCLFINYYCH